MKKRKIIASFLCLLFVFALSLTFFVPVSASEYTTVYMQPDAYSESARAYVYNGEFISVRSASPSLVYTASYTLTAELIGSLDSNLNLYATYLSLSKSFKVSDAYDDANYPNNGFLIPIILVYEFNNREERVAPVLSIYESYSSFQEAWTNEFYPVLSSLIENGTSVTIIYQSLTPNPGIYLYSENAPAEPLYPSAWKMFVRFLYGEGAELTPEQNLTLTLLATIAVLVVVLLPFALVYFILRFIFGWR